MSKVKLLDPHLINLINAGEVVETPSSVVKELVENAIDAKATEIIVEVIAGGREQIRVLDDGSGMEREEALLALERHATSKIRTIEDLSQVMTMGFRGEALPSIASISRMQLLTSAGGEATLIEVEGGRLVGAISSVRDRGTSVEVNDLFYNVPVRKRFLRSPQADQQEIQKVIVNYALAYPWVKFHLICDRKSVLRANRVVEETFLEQAKWRIEEVLGDHFRSDALMVETRQGALEVKGWMLSPKIHRPNRTGQHLFINQRPVHSAKIQEAIREGYGSSLGEGRYPLFVLYYTIPPEEVDVNIHPQKKEVRFSQPISVEQVSFRAVQEALMRPNRTKAPEPLQEVVAWHAGKTWSPFEVKETLPAQEQLELDLNAPRVISTLKGYILFEAASCPVLFKDPVEEGIGIIDQKMAMLELVDDPKASKEAIIAKQPLLIPETIELTRHETAQIEEMLPHFEKLGVELTLFGHSTLLLSSSPPGMSKRAILDLIHHALGETKRSKKRVSDALTLGLVDRKMSCQEAVAFIKRLANRATTKEREPGNPWVHLLTIKEMARFFRG